ncbi:MAG TPA: histidine kinase N-terminal 7TM domain-containing protein [Pseudobacteroides sp.]|uniref:histidine kinase N-terminal 7TM domain-containing diguanylate cyclase n=1 Tax=Pseudobacteroides sp. TaxID=1968840 RepID=UPI002F95777E
MFIILLYMSMASSSLLLANTMRKKNKTPVARMFIYLLSALLYSGIMDSITLRGFIFSIPPDNSLYDVFYRSKDIPVFFIPVIFLLMSLVYINPNANIRNPKYLWFWVLPCISSVMWATNDWHGLLWKAYDIHTGKTDIGYYGYIHVAYLYACVFIGFYNFLRYALINSAAYFKQLIFIILGIIPPMVLSITSLFFTPLTPDDMVISFSATALFFWIAINKYGFCDITPIALKTIMDHMSEALVIIDKNLTVVDFNKKFVDLFGNSLKINIGNSFQEIAKTLEISYVEGAKDDPGCYNTYEYNNIKTQEKRYIINGSERFFEIEPAVVTMNKKNMGQIILFKDVTRHYESMAILREKNIQLDKYNTELKVQNEKIVELNQRLKELADMDGLTGIFNRRVFSEKYAEKVSKILKYTKHNIDIGNVEDFGIAIVDIDDFKKINDKYGACCRR